MLIFFIFLGIIALFFFAQKEYHKFLFSFPAFKVKEIQVRGISPEKMQALIKKTNLKKGRNIFKLNLSEISHQFSQELLVKKVVILRHLPDKIIIEVKQRTPFVITKWNEQIFGVDKDGTIIPEPPDPSSFSEVKGILEKNHFLGEKINGVDLRIITRIQDLFSKALPHLQISALDLSQKEKIILFSDKRKFYLSSDNPGNNLSLLPKVLADLAQKGIEYEYVDLRFKDIYVKPIKK